MPKFIPPEQLLILQEKGVIAPPNTEVSATNNAFDTTLRVLGNVGLPGYGVVERIEEPVQTGTNLGIDQYPKMELGFTDARIELQDLFDDTEADLTVPMIDSQELVDINWGRLQQAGESYRKLGMRPKLVINPEGLLLPRWRTLYKNLRKWQEENNPDDAYRLGASAKCDALWVSEEVAEKWNSMVVYSRKSGWNVSVLPAVTNAPVLDVNHAGMDKHFAMPTDLKEILNALPNSQGCTFAQLDHPSVETYLTLQAMSLYSGQQPVDDRKHATWLKDIIDVTTATGKTSRAGLCGSWIPDSGYVRLTWKHISNRDDRHGVRPTVRG